MVRSVGCTSGPQYDAMWGWLRLVGPSARAVHRRSDLDTRCGVARRWLLPLTLADAEWARFFIYGCDWFIFELVWLRGMIRWLRVYKFFISALNLLLSCALVVPGAAAQVGHCPNSWD